MRLRIHHRLFLGFTGVVGLLAVLTVVLVGRGLRRELTDVYRAELRRELALVRELVAERADAHPDSLAGLITRRIGYRVTLIDADGTVIGDSDVAAGGLGEVENHGDRPEVRAALLGGVGFAERRSATVGERLLYGAVPARHGGRSVVLRIAAGLDEVDAAVARSQGAVAAAGALAMALALLVAYLLSRGLARPLVTLADRAGALAAGDFTRRVPRHLRVVELDELSQAFNRLSDELAVRLGELERERDEMQTLIDCMAEGVVALTEDARVLRMNRAARTFLELPRFPAYAPAATLIRQAELRELLEEAVVRPLRAREIALGGRSLIVSARPLDLGGAVVTFLDITEIRRLEQVRRDFVANASHELKTPLTAVRGFAETLLDDDPPPPLRHEFLASIRANTLRMQRLVDDLLDLSRLESGGWVAEREPLRVDEVARETWKGLGEWSGEEAIAFEVRGRAVALADAQGLSQVFRNLFENSLRHTPEGGSIVVEVSEGEGAVEVAVRDTGGGISAGALPRIFERFFRADPARSREAGGTGLGLAIVRHLVLAMGGAVAAESQVGKGTTIRFTLPAAEGGGALQARYRTATRPLSPGG